MMFAPDKESSMGEGHIARLPDTEAHARAVDAGIPTYIADLSVFQVLLHSPPLAKAVNDLLAHLLFKATFDARLRELAIMRIGWITGSVYEWTQHWRIAPAFGVDEADLLAVRDWEAHDGFGPAERAVLAATDESVRDGAISPPTWAALERDVSADPEVLLELVASLGGWRMISMMLRSLLVPLEDDVDPWPPDGAVPGSL